MDHAEQEQAVEDLEQRVERLRALYEQYFMGIEKIEPLIPRKEVDRRIYLLRREQIRNTGLRFKMQQIISRYNTFAQYWQRIMREIENGTYKRDLARAAKRFGTEPLTAAAKRRFSKKELEQIEAGKAERVAAAAEPPPEARAEAGADRGRDEDEDTSPFRRLGAEVVPAGNGIPQSAPPAASAPEPAAHASSSPPASAAPASPAASPAAAASAAPSAPKGPQPRKQVVQQMPVELDEDDDLFAGLNVRSSSPPSPPSAGRPAAASTPPRGPSLPPSSPQRPAPPSASQPVSLAPGAPGAPVAPGGPRPSAPQPPAASPSSAQPPSAARPPAAPPVAPASGVRPPVPPARPPSPSVSSTVLGVAPPPASSPQPPAPRPTQPSAAPAAARPSQPLGQPPARPAPPPPGPPAPSQPSAAASPAPAQPVARPAAAAQPAARPAQPAQPAARPAQPTAARPGDPSLSDARIREIYARYVDAKRQCNESTAQITFENLAKSLRESAPKLKEKHGGKNVDFDVVIKDGRAVLKPVLKG